MAGGLNRHEGAGGGDATSVHLLVQHICPRRCGTARRSSCADADRARCARRRARPRGPRRGGDGVRARGVGAVPRRRRRGQRRAGRRGRHRLRCATPAPRSPPARLAAAPAGAVTCARRSHAVAGGRTGRRRRPARERRRAGRAAPARAAPATTCSRAGHDDVLRRSRATTVRGRPARTGSTRARHRPAPARRAGRARGPRALRPRPRRRHLTPRLDAPLLRPECERSRPASSVPSGGPSRSCCGSPSAPRRVSAPAG